MHLNIITRGEKHEVDRTISAIESTFFEMNDKQPTEYLKLGVRPLQIWELVCPDSAIGEVQRMLWGTNQNMNYHGKMIKWIAPPLRALLKSKKVPSFDEKLPRRLTYISPHIGIHPIGIKKDVFWGKDERV